MGIIKSIMKFYYCGYIVLGLTLFASVVKPLPSNERNDLEEAIDLLARYEDENGIDGAANRDSKNETANGSSDEDEFLSDEKLETRLVEGDMILIPGLRNGVISEKSKWKNREIPYELAPEFSKAEANIIHNAVKEFAKKSCVTVRPKIASDVDYIYVTGTKSGCWSVVGCNGGRQPLNLNKKGCLVRGTIIHEFLHAAGFYHQHNTWNRDQYVKIIWENIAKNHEHIFKKHDKQSVSNYDQPYDYGSIMHYSDRAFSKNGKRTIIPKDSKWIDRLGMREEMSKIDVAKLKAMYKCR